MFVASNVGSSSGEGISRVSMINLSCVDIPIELQKSLHGLRKVPLFFCEYCKKLNRKNKVQRRVVIMTLDHMYVCHPNGDIVRCFPFSLVTKIIHDSVRYQLGIIVPTEYDLLIEVADSFHFINVFSTLRGLHPFDEPLEIEPVKRQLRSGFQSSLADGSYQPVVIGGESPSAPVVPSQEEDPFFAQLGGYVAPQTSSSQAPHKESDRDRILSSLGISRQEAADIEAEDREAKRVRLEEADGNSVENASFDETRSRLPNDESDDDSQSEKKKSDATSASRGSASKSTGGPRTTRNGDSTAIQSKTSLRWWQQGAIGVKLADWWFYAKQAVPALQRLPPGVIPNWNQQYYQEMNDEDRHRNSSEYRAQYEGSFLFKILFKKGNHSKLAIHHERVFARDNDPFVFGENVAGHEDEVCIGKPPYTVRIGKPEGFRLCLYTGITAEGDQGQEYDVKD